MLCIIIGVGAVIAMVGAGAQARVAEGESMRRFVLTVLAGTALLSAASLVLARQGDRLIKKIEQRIEQQAGRHFDPVAADARARTEDTADLPRGVESVEATVRAPW